MFRCADDSDEQSIVFLRDDFRSPVEVPGKFEVFSTALRLVEFCEIGLKASDEQQWCLQRAATGLNDVVPDRAKQTKPINLDSEILAFLWSSKLGHLSYIFLSVSIQFFSLVLPSTGAERLLLESRKHRVFVPSGRSNGCSSM